MARQCHIVDHNTRIFLGDLSEKKVNGKNVILWKDFDYSERRLNNDLEPEFDDDVKSRVSEQGRPALKTFSKI